MVVVDVVAQKTFLLEVGDPRLHHLVEDVVAPLDLLLEGDPSLLEEVGLDVATSQLSLDVEVDADKLSLSGKQLTRRLETEKILTNLEELSFLAVFALPKASSSGLVWTI